ncbi:unnamed protein product [Prunus brigantina]
MYVSQLGLFHVQLLQERIPHTKRQRFIMYMVNSSLFPFMIYFKFRKWEDLKRLFLNRHLQTCDQNLNGEHLKYIYSKRKYFISHLVCLVIFCHLSAQKTFSHIFLSFVRLTSMSFRILCDVGRDLGQLWWEE